MFRVRDALIQIKSASNPGGAAAPVQATEKSYREFPVCTVERGLQALRQRVDLIEVAACRKCQNLRPSLVA
jgi:hypothetical protein